VAVLAGALGLYFLVAANTAWNTPPRLWTAEATAWLLRLLGAGVSAQGTLLEVKDLRFAVVTDCTPLGPMLLLWGAILAFPAPLRSKLLGMVLGGALLTALNLVRMVSLILLGMARPELLPVAHLLVWQSVMVLAAVMLWLAWLAMYTRAARG
jgi:exosortase/archaeosortase family protein